MEVHGGGGHAWWLVVPVGPLAGCGGELSTASRNNAALALKKDV